MKNIEWITILPIWALALTACNQKSEGQTRTPSRAESVGKQTATGQSGAQMDSSPQGAKPMPAPRRYLGFKVGAHEIFVVKIADTKTVPAGKFHGKEDFTGKAESLREPAYLVHVLVPSAAKGMRLSVESGGQKVPLAPPTLIYRMPNSPLRTHAVLQGRSKARLVGLFADGAIGSLELGDSLEILRSMEFYWNSSDSGYLDYKDLPSSLYGSMGD